MKFDDPEFQQRIAEARQRAENMNALTLSILRNHLEAELIMNDYITTNGVSKRKLRRMKFSDKMEKCKLFAKGEENEPWWGILNAANSLRNTIAHNLDADKIDRRMADLKEKYLATMTSENSAVIENEPDDYIAMMACSTCGGFIATLDSRVKGAQAASSSQAG